MKKAAIYIVSCLALAVTVMPLYAQQSKLVTGTYRQTPFKSFVADIGSNYHFYYDPAELDSFTVTISAVNMPLTAVLKTIFNNTPFHFVIDDLNNIYITKNIIIQPQLAGDFFNRNLPSPDTSLAEAATPAERLPGKKELKVSPENILIEIGKKTASSNNDKAIVAGYVRDVKNGEPISGVSLFVDSLAIGAVTDQFGYYSLAMPKGKHILQVNSVGMKNTSRQLLVLSDGKLNIELEDRVTTLREVVVTTQKQSNIRSLQMGVNNLSIKTIKQIPVVFGEADILKVVTTLPGVTTVGEASSGFNVRGGSTDQNLILFNDATIYNPTHLFGFFSVFNPDMVKGVELYKSAIPEKFGGRLSSVLDVTSKEGNSKKLSGTGGIGPLTGKFTLEGPIIKEKTSFIVSARSSYSNWILKRIPDDEYKNSKASFSDIGLHINHTINPKNNIYINAYWSNDRFKLNRDTLYKYSNRNFNIKWKHNFNNKFYGIFLAGSDHYEYAINGTPTTADAYKLSYAINQTNLRADFTYLLNNKHTFNIGLNSTYYKLHPGAYEPDGKNSLVIKDVLEAEQGLESALYAGDQYAISSKLSVNAGIRYSMFNYLGPRSQFTYVNGIPKSENTITDTLTHNKNNIIKTYSGPEIRLVMRYALTGSASIKMSYNTLRQYVHLLSNTTAISPNDVWKLSDSYIKPQFGSQASVGFYKNFKDNTIETSVEVYYKTLKNYLDYKSGAVLVMNHHIETDVINSKGKAYGAELLIKKMAGKLNGWLSYTYSRTFLQSDDLLAGEAVNNGAFYPANFDKPHNLNAITNYKFSHRVNISFNFVYSTGRPITLPLAVFYQGGAQRIYYSERNQYRIPNYFRTDFSINIDGNHKINQFAHNSWSIGVYNITARKNPYSVYFVQQNGSVKGYKLSIFGTIIPFLTYNFRF